MRKSATPITFTWITTTARRSVVAHGSLAFPSGWSPQRGGALGLARVKEPASSAEEVALLERWGYLTDAVIQRKLKVAGFQRSINGIHLKLKRLRIRQNLDGYSACSLATVRSGLAQTDELDPAKDAASVSTKHAPYRATGRRYLLDHPERCARLRSRVPGPSRFAQGREVVIPGSGDKRSHRLPLQMSAKGVTRVC